jgi:hypothetical protein
MAKAASRKVLPERTQCYRHRGHIGGRYGKRLPEHGAPYIAMTFCTELVRGLRLGYKRYVPTLCIAILLADAIKSTSDGATPSGGGLLDGVLVVFRLCFGCVLGEAGAKHAPDSASK